MSAACYLVSYSVLPPHSRSAWFAHATDNNQKVYTEWIKAAHFRASQSGVYHITLLSCVVTVGLSTVFKLTPKPWFYVKTNLNWNSSFLAGYAEYGATSLACLRRNGTGKSGPFIIYLKKQLRHYLQNCYEIKLDVLNRIHSLFCLLS